jgi:hypothetical protein
VPTNARKTRWYSTGGPWGTGLLLLGLAVTVQGIGYLLAPADDFTGTLAWVNHGVPIRTWALLWIAAGCFSTFRALTPPQRHTDVSPVVGVVCVWSAFYFAHFAYSGLWLHAWTRDWTSGLAWLGLGALVVSWSRCVNPPTGRR